MHADMNLPDCSHYDHSFSKSQRTTVCVHILHHFPQPTFSSKHSALFCCTYQLCHWNKVPMFLPPPFLYVKDSLIRST